MLHLKGGHRLATLWANCYYQFSISSLKVQKQTLHSKIQLKYLWFSGKTKKKAYFENRFAIGFAQVHNSWNFIRQPAINTLRCLLKHLNAVAVQVYEESIIIGFL